MTTTRVSFATCNLYNLNRPGQPIYRDSDGWSTEQIVLSDLNDDGQSNTLNIIAGDPNYLRTPWSTGGSDTDLYSVGVLQALRSRRDVYYTSKHKKWRQALDHILVSRELYPHSRNRQWGFREMVVVNDHLDDKDHKESGTSDHGVVMAKFAYRPAR